LEAARAESIFKRRKIARSKPSLKQPRLSPGVQDGYIAFLQCCQINVVEKQY
jgi:hypothetical protein